MIDTLMAFWNRGYGGRRIGIFFAFLLICISISLLLATAGISWLFKPAHGGLPHNNRTFVNATSLTSTPTSLTATVPPTPVATTATTTGTTNPCTLTPVVSKTVTRGTQDNTGINIPHHLTGTPAQKGTPRVTPTVNGTSTPRPKPEPTPTATPEPTQTMTPTVTATATGTPTPTPTATPTTTPTPTSTATGTPTATTTPAPTVTVTPMPTASPTVTPIGTATPPPATVTPTVTGDPVATDTPAITPTVATTPTVTPGDGSPVATAGTNVNGVHSLFPGSSSNTGSGGKTENWHTDCLSASIAFMGADYALFMLEQEVWLVLGGSSLCTLLFWSALVLLKRKG